MTLSLVLIGSYMLGNVLTASIISKFLYKKNIREQGSGNPGARNAGRVFGKKGVCGHFFRRCIKRSSRGDQRKMASFSKHP